jgi:predicted RNA binding protein YcfA (HicA-like mRNA interferase family)
MPKVPGIRHRDAVKALQRAGFQVIREGKHVVMSNGHRFMYLATIPLTLSRWPASFGMQG